MIQREGQGSKSCHLSVNAFYIFGNRRVCPGQLGAALGSSRDHFNMVSDDHIQICSVALGVIENYYFWHVWNIQGPRSCDEEGEGG